MKKVEYEEPLDSYRVEGNLYCIADEMIEEGVERTKGHPYNNCGSSDAMSHYVSEYEGGVETSSAYCFSCAQSFTQAHLAKSSLADELGIDNEGNVIKEKRVFERKPKQPRITREQIQEVISYGYECTLKHGPNRGKPIRGILEEYNKFFGHITKKDKNGNPIVRFYPETNDGNMYGYKTRTFPKNFGYENKGITGIKNDLSGQIKFKDMQFRDIVIVAGEEDKVAFFQQFDLYQKKRTKQSGGEYAPMPVVSPNTGEKSAVTQIRDQYDFVNRAERIFIGMDNDEVGRQASKNIAEIFPSSKIYIISWSYKDPNNAINNTEGKDYSAQTIRDFYNAKPLDSCGFVGSGELDSMIEKELLVPKIPLPHFMKDLQKMMAGGIPLGYIINIIGETGGGKTSFVNEMLYDWIFNSPHKMGVISLELTAAQYGIAILSRHIGKKLNLFELGQDAVDYINTPEILEKRKQLWKTDEGEDRWTLLDEREGSLVEIQKQAELLYRRFGCKLLVLDPLQDILDGSSNEEQSLFMKWEKKMVKLGVTIININHTRKGTGKNTDGTLRDLLEDDIHGSSAIAKSGGANIFLMRDKYGETEIEKNTTYIKAGKIRWAGKSGWAGKWYYDSDSHTIHDFKEYFNENPDKLPVGFDTESTPFEKKEGKGSNRQFSRPSEPESVKKIVPELKIEKIELPNMEK